jgi:hypothetical protein
MPARTVDSGTDDTSDFNVHGGVCSGKDVRLARARFSGASTAELATELEFAKVLAVGNLAHIRAIPIKANIVLCRYLRLRTVGSLAPSCRVACPYHPIPAQGHPHLSTCAARYTISNELALKWHA